MIDPTKLSTADTGRWVWYRPIFGEWEKGRLKTWNEGYIFVVYGDKALHNRWLTEASQPTQAECLDFIEHGEFCQSAKGFRCICMPDLKVREKELV